LGLTEGRSSCGGRGQYEIGFASISELLRPRVGGIYFFWVLTILQFRECGLFGAACSWKLDTSGEIVLSIVLAILPQVAVYSVLIAFFRAVLWLPNLIIELLRGSFLDWLLVRDVPPMKDFLSALAQILP
jgi:hypothetical protein